jgi:hypothetical protein
LGFCRPVKEAPIPETYAYTNTVTASDVAALLNIPSTDVQVVTDGDVITITVPSAITSTAKAKLDALMKLKRPKA